MAWRNPLWSSLPRQISAQTDAGRRCMVQHGATLKPN